MPPTLVSSFSSFVETQIGQAAGHRHLLSPEAVQVLDGRRRLSRGAFPPGRCHAVRSALVVACQVIVTPFHIMTRSLPAGHAVRSALVAACLTRALSHHEVRSRLVPCSA